MLRQNELVLRMRSSVRTHPHDPDEEAGVTEQQDTDGDVVDQHGRQGGGEDEGTVHAGGLRGEPYLQYGADL